MPRHSIAQAPLSSTSLNLNRFPNGVNYVDLTGSDDEEGWKLPPAKKRKSGGDSFRSAVDPVPPKAKTLAIDGSSTKLATTESSLKRKTPVGDMHSRTEELVLQGAMKTWEQPQLMTSQAMDGFTSTNSFDAPQTDKRLVGDEVPIVLTPAQQAVVEMAVQGDNIFLTGAAGSGKTATLLEIQQRLKTKFHGRGASIYPQVQVVAPTGIAALPLNGKTTFSFAGWNPDTFQKPLDEVLDRVQKRIKESMKSLRVLIIEEISMVENQFLERLNLLMQHVLDSKKPFGGKQVIFLGDFHQIPPVKPFQFCLNCGEPMKTPEVAPACATSNCPLQKVTFQPGDKWAFKALVWEDLNLKHVKLEQIHRQKDSRFQDVLNKIRNGVALTHEEWNAVAAKKTLPPRAFPIRLMSLKRRVEDFNGRQLSSIDKPPVRWEALDTAFRIRGSEGDDWRANDIQKATDTHREALKQYHRFPTCLALKVGAKVVLLSNLSHETGLVNGSQGEIIGFVDTKDWATVVPEESDNKKSDWKTPTPKAKGKKNSQWPIGPSEQKKSARQVRAEEAVAQFRLEKGSQCPIVRFTNGVTKTINPVAQESLKGTSQDRYRVCRTQIPLALAWALSIHKSQGMTLEYVELSSEDIFESGQLYVGMSRATTLNGLTVTGYSRTLLAVDANVLEFYETAKWEDLGPSNRPTARNK